MGVQLTAGIRFQTTAHKLAIAKGVAGGFGGFQDKYYAGKFPDGWNFVVVYASLQGTKCQQQTLGVPPGTYNARVDLVLCLPGKCDA